MKNIQPCWDPVKNHSQNEGYFTVLTAKAFITGHDAMYVWTLSTHPLPNKWGHSASCKLSCSTRLSAFQAGIWRKVVCCWGERIAQQEKICVVKVREAQNQWLQARMLEEERAEQGDWWRKLKCESWGKGLGGQKEVKLEYTWGWLGPWEKTLKIFWMGGEKEN